MAVPRRRGGTVYTPPTNPGGIVPSPTPSPQTRPPMPTMPSPVSRTATRGSAPSRVPGFSEFISKLGQRTATRGRPAQQQPEYEPNKQVRDFQPYGVGNVRYGGGRSAPNVGPVTGREGYKERDLRNRVLKARTQKMLKKKLG